MRRTLPGIFSFEYELPTPYNVTETPKSVDLENELPSVLQFEIGPSDIGGTLSVQLQLDHSRVSSVKDLNYLKTQEKNKKFHIIVFFLAKENRSLKTFL